MKIRRLFCATCALLCAAVMLAAPLSVSADGYSLPEDVTLTAKSAVVLYVDASVSGAEAIERGADALLYEKDADAHVAPGALNRLALGLAAMSIIQRKGIDMNTATGKYTYSLQSSHVWGTGLVTANMSIGETWTVRDLLAVSMIQTAADASAVLAYTLGGSVQLFVDEMNRVAAELGCNNTHFTNVNGADDPEQYTSARDAYKMLRRAMDHPELEAMMSATEHTVTPVSGGRESSWPNTNSLLRVSSDYYYSPAVLGKTGASGVDGYSLASFASADGYRYIVVVCGSPQKGSHYTEVATLSRWAFRNFSYKTIIPAGQPVTRIGVDLAWNTDSINVVAKHALSCLVISDLDENTVTKKITLYEDALNADGNLTAPVEKNAAVGKVELFIRTDQKIGEVELVTAESVKRSELLYVLSSLGAFFSSPWFWLGVGLLVVLVAAYAILLYRYNHKSTKRNKRSKKYKSLK